MIALVTCISLWAAPAAASPSPTPVAKKEAPAPTFEVVFSEALLGALMTAAAPFEEDVEQEVGALGFVRNVTVHVKLTDPVVAVTKAGIKVTMNYQVTSPGGMLDARGVAHPEMQIVAVPAKNGFEGRLVKSGITLPGGLELPVEDMVDPIELPGVISEVIDIDDDKQMTVEATAKDVILEDGKIRVKGTVAFKQPPKK